jgi:hypothetical protein
VNAPVQEVNTGVHDMNDRRSPGELKKNHSKKNQLRIEENKILKKEFGEKLVPFVGTETGRYPKQMIRNFFDYWTETNESGTKMRFQNQSFFDVSKRLSTWFRNENKNSFSKEAKTTALIISSPLEKRNIHA